MLLDARSITRGRTISADVCIVGAGAAGITVALGLRDCPARVLLLEGGGEEPDPTTQLLCEGATTGRPYYALDECRLRCLGGSTNQWGGWCRPLDPLDFEVRDWVPHSGWPFPSADLDPYYRRAQVVCCHRRYDYEPGSLNGSSVGSVVPSGSGIWSDTVFHIAPTRFATEYRTTLEDSKNISLMLHANALEIEMDASVQTAECVDVATLAGNRLTVCASIIVLAAGGIENPRLLLSSRRGRKGGVGNEYGLVGRFFSDHLHLPIGVLRALPRGASSFYLEHRSEGAIVRGGIALSEKARREGRLLGCAVTLHNADDPHDVLSPVRQPDGYRSLRFLMRSLAQRKSPRGAWRHIRNIVSDPTGTATLALRRIVRPPARTLVAGIRVEQAPYANNRVTLDDRQDRFGKPLARLHWDLTRQDLRSVERSIELWRGALADQGVQFEPLVPERGHWLDRVAGGAHHMGTTRMHRDPRQGVVDEHCRVHGTGNLYVAGSSVFPTAGWAPPTLTIVALALRLAEHLKERLGHGQSPGLDPPLNFARNPRPGSELRLV